jgi:uncharacterized membrane protein
MKSSTMGGTQWMAWIMCLILALGAMFLALSNAYRIKRIERAEGSATLKLLQEQNDILRGVRESLKSDDEDVAEPLPAPGMDD